MEHSQVRNFLHEFGHVLHFIFAGRVEWAAQNTYEIENDVLETPSQLLEEWAYDYDTLRLFATNDEGVPIPRDLVAKMNASRRFGEAFSTINQLGYAAGALALYLDDMSNADLTNAFVSVHQRYAIAALPEGVHPQASFTHLSGYGPSYYTYQWSKALAVDLLSEFREAGLSDVRTARRYRRTILAPGGSDSMNVLARRFLGRDWSVRAYRDELEMANSSSPILKLGACCLQQASLGVLNVPLCRSYGDGSGGRPTRLFRAPCLRGGRERQPDLLRAGAAGSALSRRTSIVVSAVGRGPGESRPAVSLTWLVRFEASSPPAQGTATDGGPTAP